MLFCTQILIEQTRNHFLRKQKHEKTKENNRAPFVFLIFPTERSFKKFLNIHRGVSFEHAHHRRHRRSVRRIQTGAEDTNLDHLHCFFSVVVCSKPRVYYFHQPVLLPQNVYLRNKSRFRFMTSCSDMSLVFRVGMCISGIDLVRFSLFCFFLVLEI